MSAIDDLTPMPDQPEISEGNQAFHQKAYALYKWMREKLAPAIIEVRNLIVNAVTGAFTSTSTTSFAIGTGDISITIGAGRSFVPGTSIRAAYVTDPTKYVDGIVKTYNSTSGALVFAGQTTSGTGTYANWSISIIAASGSFASLVTNKFTGLQSWANEVTIASDTTIDLTAAGSNQFKLIGTVPVLGATMPQGAIIKGRAVAATPLVNSSSFIIQGGKDYKCTPGDWLELKKDADGNVHVSITTISGKSVVDVRPSVRQTVLSGPVDSNGFANFGGSLGATTIAISGTLRVTSSNGEADSVLDVVDPSWTGLSTNGTMYLWIDAVTGQTGKTALAPIYQFGGSYSATSDQHTFNVQEMVMKVGNGSGANQSNRVFIGECVVSSGLVSAITWYAIKGRYHSGRFSAAPSNTYSKNHNIGTAPELMRMKAMGAISAGGTLREFMLSNNGSNYPSGSLSSDTKNQCSLLLQADARLFTGVTSTSPVAEAVINVDRGW